MDIWKIQTEEALKQIQSDAYSEDEKIFMLIEMADNLQIKPKQAEQFDASIALYDKALSTIHSENTLLIAQVHCKKAIAMMRKPESLENIDHLTQAAEWIREAIDVFEDQGSVEETAEAYMNLGIVLQDIANQTDGKMGAAIQSYQAAIKRFDAQSFPEEYAILHNNIAIAYLSMAGTSENGKMREALAVQSFEEALQTISLVDHPAEYAMLQNNLGNALQYVSSSHPVENNLRAIEAYDEALKVRTAANMPQEYANTISNKANCISNLPDNMELPESENPQNLRQAILWYEEANKIFTTFGDLEKVSKIQTQIDELLTALNAITPKTKIH